MMCLKFIYHVNVGAPTSILMTNQPKDPPLDPGNVTTDIIIGDYGNSSGQRDGVAFVSDTPPTGRR